MVPVDRDVARNITHQMSTAKVDIDELSERTGISQSLLMKRLTQGSFKMSELAKLADVLGCGVASLTASDRDAA